MASYLDALRAGHSLRTDRPAPDAAEIAAITADPASHLAALRDPPPWMRLPNGRRVPRLPGAVLFLAEGETFLGSVNLRYALNDRTRISGGHVGYAIRPDRRRRGHGHEALALALPRLARHGIDTALITCDDGNLGSRRIIERAGGGLVDLVPHPDRDGVRVRRYLVPLPPSPSAP